MPYLEVRQARVQDEPIPLLEDILGTWPDARVNIDAKHGAAPALIEVLDRTRAFDRVCIGSFSTRRATRLRNLTGGRVCSWMGRTELLRLRLRSVGVPVPCGSTPCAQAPVRQGSMLILNQRFVDAAHVRGHVVHVWTINDRVEMSRLLDLGVDGIFSDRPTVLKDVLCERGQWT